jgi:type IV pilus assembly protein PilE
MLLHGRTGHAGHAGQAGHAGFTLIECLIVLAIVAILAGLTVPSLRGQERRMARLDAVQALMRVQSEQESLRALSGLYTSDLRALRGVQPSSPQGRYTLSLATQGPDGYRAVAQATGEQQADRDCAAITLDVNLGFATHGPTPACWDQ